MDRFVSGLSWQEDHSFQQHALGTWVTAHGGTATPENNETRRKKDTERTSSGKSTWSLFFVQIDGRTLEWIKRLRCTTSTSGSVQSSSCVCACTDALQFGQAHLSFGPSVSVAVYACRHAAETWERPHQADPAARSPWAGSAGSSSQRRGSAQNAIKYS